MARNRIFAVIVVVCAALVFVGSAAAQFNAEPPKNELSGLIGRTFISDQGVKGITSFDTILHSGKGLTFEANYGRRIYTRDLVTLTAEVPIVFNPDEDIHFSVNLVPGGYSSFFVTPSLRANVFPHTMISPWVSFGGGIGHFSADSTLEFGGPNPGKTGTTTGVLQGGIGLDVRILRSLSLRAAGRDFYSGVPQLNVDTGKSRQHNLFAGVGVIWHF